MPHSCSVLTVLSLLHWLLCSLSPTAFYYLGFQEPCLLFPPSLPGLSPGVLLRACSLRGGVLQPSRCPFPSQRKPGRLDAHGSHFHASVATSVPVTPSFILHTIFFSQQLFCSFFLFKLSTKPSITISPWSPVSAPLFPMSVNGTSPQAGSPRHTQLPFAYFP